MGSPKMAGQIRVALAGIIGVAAAALFFSLPSFGVHISTGVMMATAAALSIGAASAVLSNALLTKPAAKSRADLMSGPLRSSGLILAFPRRSDSIALSIRPDSRPELLDVIKNPEKYAKDIVVWLRSSADETFNPVMLKQLFAGLSRQKDFQHVILVDKNEEFIGYIPAYYARTRFCGQEAEVEIARYIVDVFREPANSANLHQIQGGAAMNDVISDTAQVGEAIKRMTGGFKRLVVLRNGYHRKPIGLIDFNELMSGALTGNVPKPKGLIPDLRW